MVPCENSSNNSKPTTRKSDDQKDTNVGNKARLPWSNLSSSVNGVSCDQKPQAIVADIANSHPKTSPVMLFRYWRFFFPFHLRPGNMIIVLLRFFTSRSVCGVFIDGQRF